jgi:D-inositol-3-phosphate glycosyltransferase
MRTVAEECGGCDGLTVAIVGGDVDVPPEQMSAEMARLHKLRADLGIEDLVTFLGKRGQETLPYYYSAAEVVVMPSHYESFGMVALEAMACGTPVIASRVGGLRFSVVHGYTGLHVPVGNADALAAALLKVLKNDALRWELAGNSRRMAQQFGWPTIARQVVDLYGQVLATGAQQSPQLAAI